MSRRITALLAALVLMFTLTPSALAVERLTFPSGLVITMPPNPLPAPDSVTAAAGERSIQLRWSRVPGAQCYQILRRRNGGSFTLLGTADSTQWEDTQVPKGSRCTYRVRAAYTFLGSLIPGEDSHSARASYYPLYGHTICLDAGHGSRHALDRVYLAPNSQTLVTGGTTGTASPFNRYSEADLALKVSQRLQKALEEEGATVVMTRTTEECDLNNVQRCEIAKNAGAELTIHVHANSAFNAWVNGIEVLVPADTYCDEDLVEQSRQAGKKVCRAMVEHTGAKDRGLISRDDLPGLNWSSNPSILVELGYMSNQQEDEQLQKSSYQKKLVAGILEGTMSYFKDLDQSNSPSS